jgi:hypothetical protein
MDILDKVLKSDKGWFHLSGYVNSQKKREQNMDAENTHAFHERPLHSLKSEYGVLSLDGV